MFNQIYKTKNKKHGIKAICINCKILKNKQDFGQKAFYSTKKCRECSLKAVNMWQVNLTDQYFNRRLK